MSAFIVKEHHEYYSFVNSFMQMHFLYYKYEAFSVHPYTLCVVDSCVRNCRWRPNVHEATELTLAVHSLSIVSTKWTITPDIDWKQDMGSDRSRQFLSIYEDVLQSGITYTVQVFGKPPLTNMCYCLN